MIPTSPPVTGPLAEPLRTVANADTWFRLRRPDGLPGQLRDLARRELDLAAEGLWASNGLALDAGVLYACSAVDKVRVLLRLARGGLSKRLRTKTAPRLAAMTRQLAEARDPGTLESVVERLRQSTREPGLRDGLMALGGRLAERRHRAAAALAEGGGLGKLRGELERLHAEARGWKIRGDGFELLGPGIGRAYRKARRTMREVEAKPGSAKRGERWASAAGSFGTALRLIEPVWPVPLKALSHEVDRVVGRLKEAREFERLLTRASRDPSLMAGLPAKDLGDRIVRIRDRFRSEALSTGARLFVDPPQVYEERLGLWWTVWESDTGLASPN
jgi:hypothetical protein